MGKSEGEMIYNINEVFLWEQGGQNIEGGRDQWYHLCATCWTTDVLSTPPQKLSSSQTGNNPWVNRPSVVPNVITVRELVQR